MVAASDPFVQNIITIIARNAKVHMIINPFEGKKSLFATFDIESPQKKI
jgi:hypothetical protein